MATAHVVFSYYTVVYSECDHENNQSTYIFIVVQNMLPGNILVVAFSLKRMFRRKTILKFWLLMAENTVRGVRLFLRFHMYLFLAQCDQIYLF